MSSPIKSIEHESNGARFPHGWNSRVLRYHKLPRDNLRIHRSWRRRKCPNIADGRAILEHMRAVHYPYSHIHIYSPRKPNKTPCSYKHHSSIPSIQHNIQSTPTHVRRHSKSLPGNALRNHKRLSYIGGCLYIYIQFYTHIISHQSPERQVV